MITPYVYADLGQQDPNQPNNWLGATVVQLRWAREGVRPDVQNAVNDASGGGVYKHFVPWLRIFRSLEEACMNKTRNECHTVLSNTLGNLQINDTSGIQCNLHRAAYDSWYSWAVEAICDWPRNLYQGASHGDHDGQTVDMPTQPYSMALQDRLDGARLAMADYFGLSTAYRVAFN